MKVQSRNSAELEENRKMGDTILHTWLFILKIYIWQLKKIHACRWFTQIKEHIAKRNKLPL